MSKKYEIFTPFVKKNQLYGVLREIVSQIFQSYAVKCSIK